MEPQPGFVDRDRLRGARVGDRPGRFGEHAQRLVAPPEPEEEVVCARVRGLPLQLVVEGVGIDRREDLLGLLASSPLVEQAPEHEARLAAGSGLDARGGESQCERGVAGVRRLPCRLEQQTVVECSADVEAPGRQAEHVAAPACSCPHEQPSQLELQREVAPGSAASGAAETRRRADARA